MTINAVGRWWNHHRGALLFALSALLIRLAWSRRVLLEGWPYFADADCYTRMFRVRQLLESGAWFQPFHTWENFPEGISPHTTSLLDWMIALVALPLNLILTNGLDWAGWITPPLLAAGGAWAIWHLVNRLQTDWTRWLILLTYLLHPILLWGNAAGRPDHQALLVPLLTILILVECRRAQENRFHLPAGVLWAVALWVSLYEPVVLLLTILFGHLLTRITCRNHPAITGWPTWLAGMLGVFVPLWLLEGARLPDLTIWNHEMLRRWLAGIGETRPAPAVYFLTLGLAWPMALVLTLRRSRTQVYRALLLLPALLAVLVLSILHQRWFYFLPFTLSLALLPALTHWSGSFRRWLVGTLHLLPMIGWLIGESAQLRPPQDLADLRRMAGQVSAPGAIMAPGWIAPALLYYSGQPIVASSSHQSLPGILDWAQFTTGRDFVAADELLQKRQTRWIVIENPIRTYPYAIRLLHGNKADVTVTPADFQRLIILRLWEFKSVPTRYRLVYASPERKLYHYTPPSDR